MAGLLEQKVGFITGAASGIGRAAAAAMVREGARVVVIDLSDTVHETHQFIKGMGGESVSWQIDVRDAEAVAKVVDDTVSRWGGIHVACNAAGIFPESTSATEWGSAEAFDVTLDVNCRGVLNAMTAQLHHMMNAGAGAIVNVASQASFSGRWAAGYTASKHAVVGLTRSAAIHYAANGIRINAVCPGLVETGLTSAILADSNRRAELAARHPMNRVGTAEEIADAILFLLSDRSSFITGHALMVDGGACAM